MTTQILNGDCLELMKDLEDKSVDLFICDLPYMDINGKAETNCKWNQSLIDLEKFWKEFKRIRKSKRTACIHFCSTKFGFSLIKSWEKGFKMDMVWKKRNKTGGLQSRYRPMRNHEMVYFFYEQAPKYNRDKYHKRINNVKHAKSDTTKEKKEENTILKREKKNFNPVQPASVFEEKTNGMIKYDSKVNGHKYGKKEHGAIYTPPNPASIVEQKPHVNIHGLDKSHPTWGQRNSFVPPNPSSIVEEDKCCYGFDLKDKQHFAVKDLGKNRHFEPVQPASVVEEKIDIYGETKTQQKKRREGKKVSLGTRYPNGNEFEPPNPVSVVDEDEPVSMFESEKVFIGKRHHQTEKPQDILEFFIKYWSDEGDVILDPTMGSGSTGVACKKLKRDFIGFEMNEDIFKVAQKRIEN